MLLLLLLCLPSPSAPHLTYTLLCMQVLMSLTYPARGRRQRCLDPDCTDPECKGNRLELLNEMVGGKPIMASKFALQSLVLVAEFITDGIKACKLAINPYRIRIIIPHHKNTE
jgi:hypothetical protein